MEQYARASRLTIRVSDRECRQVSVVFSGRDDREFLRLVALLTDVEAHGHPVELRAPVEEEEDPDRAA